MDWKAIWEAGGTQTPELEIALRLGLAAIFGGVIGLDRELHERPAGLRTHMLIALAAALFTIVTFEIFHKARAMENGGNPDPVRVISAVTSGVAFLAAGAIIQNRGAVQGLTTGAGMWMAGALGVTSGAGFYRLALIAVLFTIAILTILRRVERLYIDDGKVAQTNRNQSSRSGERNRENEKTPR